jgi:hypothetical protein
MPDQPIEEAKGVIFPICSKCGSDPLKLKRLRYDFPDGVLLETFFCSNCRVIIGAQIVGIERLKTK